MNEKTWNSCLPRILTEINGRFTGTDENRVNLGVNAYLIRSLDRTALQFSIPVLNRQPMQVGEDIPSEGYDGGIGVLIEHIKKAVPRTDELHPVAGIGTRHPTHYEVNTEPVTFSHSPHAIGETLWKADRRNFADENGVHLEIKGALPYPGSPGPENERKISGQFTGLLTAVEEEIGKVPEKRLEEACLLSFDQKKLREQLPELGLVCFVGDGTKAARNHTRHRGHFRVAGPKNGVNIPFSCPPGLDPVEVELAGSGTTATGLGIRRGEFFAIVGSNAQGKSTFLKGIIAGEDDHLSGDGREHLVTVRGVATARAGGTNLAGADISLFFSDLPPGVAGTPKHARGGGSGSMVMADQFQQALRKKSSVILFDEDQSATNLLVPSCVQTGEVTPLSTIIATRREVLNGTSLVFAASSMDILTAQADRIMMLDRHIAASIGRNEFRRRLHRHLMEVADQIKEK